MSQSAISIQNFLGIQNTSGNNTVWGDIAQSVFLDNLKNNEVLGNVLHKKKIQLEDTIPFEYTIFPQVSILDVSKIGASSLVLDKVMVNFPDTKWLEAGYKIDVRTKRSMKDWAMLLGTREANMYVAKSDNDNLIALDAVITYALASGRFKLIPNLDTAGSTKEEIADAIAQVAEMTETIVRTRTEVNAGLNYDRLNYVFSGYVANNFVKAANYMNTGDASFNVFQNGVLARIYGKGYGTSIYLDSISTKGEAMNNVETFNFSGVLGMVYDIDNFEVYTKPWTELGINGWQQSQTDKTSLAREVTWKTMGLVKPSREHLQYIILKTAPTIETINAARTKLTQFQPVLYKSYGTPINDTQYNAIIANAANMRFAGAPDIPQDGTPATRNKNGGTPSDREIKKQAKEILKG